MHNNKFSPLKKSKKVTLPILYLLCCCQLLLTACSKNEPDQQTLHYVTRDGINTTLNLEHEIYNADNNPKLFYMNFKYYTKNKNGQWAISDKPDGPWKVFPDQGAVPESLLKMKFPIETSNSGNIK